MNDEERLHLLTSPASLSSRSSSRQSRRSPILSLASRRRLEDDQALLKKLSRADRSFRFDRYDARSLDPLTPARVNGSAPSPIPPSPSLSSNTSLLSPRLSPTKQYYATHSFDHRRQFRRPVAAHVRDEDLLPQDDEATRILESLNEMRKEIQVARRGIEVLEARLQDVGGTAMEDGTEESEKQNRTEDGFRWKPPLVACFAVVLSLEGWIWWSAIPSTYSTEQPHWPI